MVPAWWPSTGWRTQLPTGNRPYVKKLERIMLGYAVMAGDEHAAGVFRRQVTALETGLPVVVHGYQVDLPTEPGPLVLEPDGRVEPLTPVYRDPAASPRTVVGYRRADGTLVG